MGNSLLSLFRLTNISNPRVPGYFVASTAPLNVEGDATSERAAHVAPESVSTEEAQRTLQEIADCLYQKVAHTNGTEPPELVISVHGFSNSPKDSYQRCQQIHEYINTDENSLVRDRSNNLLYVGYRWSSEALSGEDFLSDHVLNSFKALPILARYILAFSLISILLLLLIPAVQNLLSGHPLDFLFWLVLFGIAFLFFSILTLIVLRLVVYFRDKYRATHFGIPDLVEFLRQLDKLIAAQIKGQYLPEMKLMGEFKDLLVRKVKEKIEAKVDVVKHDQVIQSVCGQIAEVYCTANTVDTINLKQIEADACYHYPIAPEPLKKVILAAIEIVTQEAETELAELRDEVIQILVNRANQFWADRQRIKLTFIGHSMGGYVITSAVRTLCDVFDLPSIGTLGLTSKIPTASIGCNFQLSRLVLVAPDIPINTIISGRSNFLSSSLRRFQETYLFSNEGDLALRLASTLANYFTFPSRTRESGYRLGNVAIRSRLGYGILNMAGIDTYHSEQQILDKLFVDSFDIGFSLRDIRARYNLDETHSSEQISKLFTFFDCTDYCDRLIRGGLSPQRVLNLNKWQGDSALFDRPALRYLRELVHYIRLSVAYAFNYRDTHAAYFDGEFSRHLIYRLAFLGFGGLLDSLVPEEQAKLAETQQRIARCQQVYADLLQNRSHKSAEEVERAKREFERQQNRLKDTRLAALSVLNQCCEDRAIQVLLAPEQYEVEINGRSRPRVRREILNAKPIPASILQD